MRYRIFEKGGEFGVQRKKLFRWVWYCGSIFGWSNYWGKRRYDCEENRRRFSSLDEALKFIAKEKFGDDKGTLITSENINNYNYEENVLSNI